MGINATAVTGETSDVIVGDGRSASTLLAAGIREANTLVLASTSDSVNLSILVQARVLNPHIRVIDRLFNASLGHCLDRALPDSLAYYRFLDLPPDPSLSEALTRVKYRKVFLLDLLPLAEDYARTEDVAPGRLVPDRALVAAVLADPKSKQELAGVKEFTGRASRSQLDRWWAAIEDGRASNDLPLERATGGDSLPPPRAWPDRNPEADARLKAARPAVEQLAETLRMPTENLLTPDLLRRVAWAPPEPLTAASLGEALSALGARDWQIEQTAQVIVDAFVGSVQESTKATETAS